MRAVVKFTTNANEKTKVIEVEDLDNIYFFEDTVDIEGMIDGFIGNTLVIPNDNFVSITIEK